MGFDAAVVEQVERRSAIKRYAGHPLFVYAGFSTWFRHYDRSRPRFAVRTGPSQDGTPGAVIDDGYFAVCLNTHPYTFLGNRPLDVAPEANLDNQLSVVTFRTLSFAPTMRVIIAALRGHGGKRLAQFRRIAYAADVGQINVTGYGPFPYQVDGDFLGEATELTLSWEPAQLSLIMPD
jgi:hypothetical protein